MSPTLDIMAVLAAPPNLSVYPLDGGLVAISDPVATATRYQYTFDNGATYVQPTYSRAVLDDHPVFYYRLGEASGSTAADSTSSALNATLSGPYSLSQPTSLSGVTDPGAAFYTPGGGGATLAAASYPATATTIFSGVVRINPSTITGTQRLFGRTWSFALNGGNLQLSIPVSTGTTTAVTTTAPIAANTWQTVGFTYSGTSIQLFVNGVSLTTTAATAINADSADFTTMTTGGFVGSMQELAVFDYVLSPEQMMKFHQMTAGYFSNTAHFTGLPNGTPVSVKSRAFNATDTGTLQTTAVVQTPKTTDSLVALDRFNRTATTGFTRATPDYGVTSWEVLGTPSIDSSGFLYSGTRDVNSNCGLIVPVSTNHSATITRRTSATGVVAGNWSGPVCRYLSGSNYYSMRYSLTFGDVVVQFYNPAFGVIATINPTTDPDDVYTIAAQDESILCFVNGKLVYAYTDTFYASTNTYKAGDIFRDNNAHRHDNVVVLSNQAATVNPYNGKNMHVYKGRDKHVANAATSTP